jgi:uncharacterized alpha-E superfamily protein
MISRVADHCFWVGRYLDRSESTARLLQATRALAFDAELPHLSCWKPLVTVSGQLPDFVERFGAEAANNGTAIQRYMTWDTENPASIRTSIRAAREAARSIREVLSLDIWEATNELYLWFTGDEASNLYLSDRDELYRRIRRSTQLNLGLVRSTMLHDTPMDILWIGVLLERIGQTARILDMHHHMLDGTGGQHQILETAIWLSLLRACSGFEAFMQQHQGRVARTSVVDFLIFEDRFPRSLRYCVRSALSLTRRMWPDATAVVGAPVVERLVALDHWLTEQESNPPDSIHALLTHVVDEMGLACEAVQLGLAGDSKLPLPVAAQAQAQ